MLRGIGVSRGIVRGVLYEEKPFVPVIGRETVEPDKRPGEVQAYRNACQKAGEELERLVAALRERCAGQEEIFSAHQEILRDEAMEEEILEAIRQEGETAAAAVDSVYRMYAQRIARAKDPVIRERASDLDDVRIRLLRNLQGAADGSPAAMGQGCIAVAEEWLPSQIARLAGGPVLGVAAQRGSATCHAAIVCESLGLPALFGVPKLTGQAKPGAQAVLDAEAGTLLVDPTEEQWQDAGRRAAEFQRLAKAARQYARVPAVTTDGWRVDICLNAGSVDIAKEIDGCDGVGLFRTEFLFMEQSHLPQEEEQYEAYVSVLRQANGKPVILRTLDIGADKQLKYLPLPAEENPALGVRALRLCLETPDLFKTQLRAAWRAAAHGDLWLMFPMVGGLEDWRRARDFSLAVRQELKSQGAAVGEKVPMGTMIEIPSAALQAEQLAAEADFASVGTNDLCQYLFAADRTNARVNEYARSHSPVLMKLLGQIADAFTARGKPLSVCGELGGDPRTAAVLAGLGYHKLSMSAANMPYVRQVICCSDRQQLRVLADRVCSAATESEADAIMLDYYNAVIRKTGKGETECIQK